MRKKSTYKHSLLSRSRLSSIIPNEQLTQIPHKDLHLPISEIVIKNIISHIITKAVHIGDINYNNSKIPGYCFNYMTRFISPITRLAYMTYDTDNDLGNDITLPKNSFVDSLTSTHVNVTKMQSNSDMMRDVSMFSEQNEINKTSSRKTFNNFRRYTSNNSIKRSSIVTEMKIVKQQSTKEIMESFPYYDLHNKVSGNKNNDILDNKESSYIIALRKQVEEKEKKEAMNLKKRNLLMNGIVLTPAEINTVNDVELIEKYKKTNTMKRFFDSKNYTFDSNGKVIKRNTEKINISDNFLEANLNLKFIKQTSNDNYFHSNNNNNNNNNTHISLNKHPINKDNQIYVTDVIANNIKKPINNDTLRKTTYKLHKKIEPLSPPSGDNFDLIYPEIGVNITYEESSNIKDSNNNKQFSNVNDNNNDSNVKVKFGGMNFSSKYKRFSLRDYNNIMFLNSQQKPKPLSQFNTPSNTQFNTPNNTVNNFNVSNVNEIENKTFTSNILSHSISQVQLPIFNTNNNISLRINSKLIKSNSSACITVNKRATDNLKTTLDSLDLNKTEHNMFFTNFPGITNDNIINNYNNSINKDLFKTVKENIKKDIYFKKFNKDNNVNKNFNYNYDLNTFTSLKQNKKVNAMTPNKSYLNSTLKKNGIIINMKKSPRIRNAGKIS